MILRTFLLTGFCLIFSVVKSQDVTKSFIKNENIFILFDNADTRQITFIGSNSHAQLSSDKKFIVYLRTIKNEKELEEGEQVIEESIIIKYEISSATEKVLVHGCNTSGIGSTFISYADSDEFPFSGLCNISNVILSPDNQRVYFETDAWTVSNAIHYYYIPNGKIALFGSGNLNYIKSDGNVNITITGIEPGKGRYTQEWIYDQFGKPISPAGEMEF